MRDYENLLSGIKNFICKSKCSCLIKKGRKMRDFNSLKIAVAGTGARDIIGSTKKYHDN